MLLTVIVHQESLYYYCLYFLLSYGGLDSYAEDSVFCWRGMLGHVTRLSVARLLKYLLNSRMYLAFSLDVPHTITAQIQVP